MSKSSQQKYFVLAFVSLLGFCVSASAEDSASQPKRTILDRHDQSESTGKEELVLGKAELPAGAEIGWHTHNGDENGYVLSGDLVLKVKDKPDRVLKAGDFFFNPRGSVHSLIAAPGTAGGTALSTWVIDKDKPLANPIK